MNKENIRKIMLLAALLAAGGCSSVPAQSGFEPTGSPILSAEDGQTMITVTVTTLPPAPENDALVAASAY